MKGQCATKPRSRGHSPASLVPFVAMRERSVLLTSASSPTVSTAWLFATCARGFNNEAEKAFGVAKQMRSFNQNTPAADGSWSWPEFEAYWRRTIEVQCAKHDVCNEKNADFSKQTAKCLSQSGLESKRIRIYLYTR